MKRCSKCGIEKNLDEFYNRKSSKDGKQPYCKICLSNAARDDYKTKERRSVFVQRVRQRQQELKQLVNVIRDHNGCAFCVESTTCCLDFHHLDPSQKEEKISYLLRCKSEKRLLEEIEKCVSVCANCHRKIHAGLIQVTTNHLCKIPNNLRRKACPKNE